MLARTFIATSFAVASALLAGCADTPSLMGNSANLTTSSTTTAAAPKTDPACITIAGQIDQLRKEGISEKIEKASLKKYKMTTAELVKADQLNKANLDFQGRCSTYKPSVVSAPAPAVAATAAAAAAKAPAAPKAAAAAVAAAAPAADTKP